MACLASAVVRPISLWPIHKQRHTVLYIIPSPSYYEVSPLLQSVNLKTAAGDFLWFLLLLYYTHSLDLYEIFKMINMMTGGDIPALINLNNVYARYDATSGRICKKKRKFSSYIRKFRNGAVAKSYMRKGFLIYEEMRKYFPIYEEAVSHI